MNNPHPYVSTSPEVSEHATEKAVLPPVALIGVFGSDSDPAALIRDRDGTFQRVTVGDKIAGSEVAAIDFSRVILAKGSRTRALTLPEAADL